MSGKTNIQISRYNRDRLARLGGKDDTYNDIIGRILTFYDLNHKVNRVYEFDEDDLEEEVKEYYTSKHIIEKEGTITTEIVNMENDNGEIISEIQGDFEFEYIPFVSDVFISERSAYPVMKIIEEYNIHISIFKMSKTEFMNKWDKYL